MATTTTSPQATATRPTEARPTEARPTAPDGSPAAVRPATVRLRPWVGGWFGMCGLAVLNGVARQLGYQPHVGERTARQIATASLLLILTGYVWALHRRWPVPSCRVALAIGAAWVAATLGFEFGFGHYVEGKDWSVLFEDYDVRAGRLWVLVPLWTLVLPAVVRRAQARR